MNKYDSTADTLLHIKRVNELLLIFSSELMSRAIVHDNSKLESPEKELFDEFTPKLKGTTYGSDEYKSYLSELKVALDHHYANNSHHPEHTFSREVWKDIEGYEGIYQVSDLGRVKRVESTVVRKKQGNFTKPEKLMKPNVTPKGYLRIQLSKEGSTKNKFVHSLVAETFLDKPSGDNLQVNHKDGNKLNNKKGNLEWVTPSENQQHAYDNGLKEPVVKYVVHCEELDITTFGTEKMANELIVRGYEANPGAIWSCINGKNNTHLGLTFTSQNINEYKELNSPINGMDLFDLIEMFMDWKAATERHDDGDILKSIEINKERFGISEQICEIFRNTIDRYF